MYLFNFFISLYVVYPAPSPQAAQFNDMGTAFNALIDLAFLGEGLELDLWDPEANAELSTWQEAPRVRRARAVRPLEGGGR